jgi:hypothetical protein
MTEERSSIDHRDAPGPQLFINAMKDINICSQFMLKWLIKT